MKYIVEIDSKYVSIYHNGLILKEPTFAVVKKEGAALELLAAGKNCYELTGKADGDRISPVSGSSVTNREVAALMFKDFFIRVIPKNPFKNAEIVAPISAGLSIAEREGIESALIKTGYGRITLIESIVGLVPFADKNGQAVMNIGHGTTEFGVVHEHGIIEACSVDLGCDAIEKKITEAIIEGYNIRISPSVAAALRTELATFVSNDNSYVEITGSDILSNQPRKLHISAQSLRPVVEKCYDILLEIAESLITTIPFRLIQPVTQKGLYIAGAGASIQGLAQYIKAKLGLSVTIPNEPETAVMRGLFTAS